MAQTKVTFQDKINNITIVDREKQVAAEDLNELKSVINSNADDVADNRQTSYQLQFDTSTTAADPGVGKFRLNNATQGSATEMYISETEYNNGKLGDIFNYLSANSIISLKSIGNRAKWANIKVTSIIDRTGWYAITASIESKGTDFSGNDIIGVSFLSAGGGQETITPEDLEPYDPVNVAPDGFQGYRANSYVSYVNAGSANPQFQTESIYRSNIDIAQGVSPEDDEVNWEYLGQSAVIPSSALAKTIVASINLLKALTNYKNGDNVIVRDQSAIYEFKNTFEFGIKPDDGGSGSWVNIHSISLSKLLAVTTTNFEQYYWPIDYYVLSYGSICEIEVYAPDTQGYIYTINLTSPSIILRTGDTGVVGNDFTITPIGGGAAERENTSATVSADAQTTTLDFDTEVIKTLNINDTITTHIIAVSNLSNIERNNGLLINNSANSSGLLVTLNDQSGAIEFSGAENEFPGVYPTIEIPAGQKWRIEFYSVTATECEIEFLKKQTFA